jgi:hypothetical protein
MAQMGKNNLRNEMPKLQQTLNGNQSNLKDKTIQEL